VPPWSGVVPTPDPPKKQKTPGGKTQARAPGQEGGMGGGGGGGGGEWLS